MSWPLAKLGSHVDILSGFAFKSENFNDSGEGLPLVRIRDVVPGVSETYYSGEYSSEFLLSDGDLLIGMDGDFNRARWSGGQALLNQRVCKVTAKDDSLDQGYLYHFLPKALEKIHAETPAVTVKHLSVKGIRAIEIPLPPLHEQKRIAAILDKADTIRHKRQQAIQLADDFLRAVFLDMFGDPVTNPKGWDSCKFEDLTSLVTYGLTVRPQYHEEGIPLISAREIRTGELDFESCPKISRSDFDMLSDKGRPKKDDILFSKTGSIGHCAIVRADLDFAVTQNAARIVPNKDVCDPIFLLAFMRTNYFYDLANKEAKGNAVKDLQLGIMKDFPMYIPPVSLQNKFVDVYSKASVLSEKVSGGSILLNSNFGALSQRAFSGQL